MTTRSAQKSRGVILKTTLTTLAFMLLIAMPRGVMAKTTDIKQCLRDIQVYWLKTSPIQYKGESRGTKTPCELYMNLGPTTLTVHATSGTDKVSFGLKESTGDETRTLSTCDVDKGRIHFAFEEKTSAYFEKRENVLMTLVRGKGNSVTLITSKNENKILTPVSQNRLFCHLN